MLTGLLGPSGMGGSLDLELRGSGVVIERFLKSIG